ncbi:MAG: ABC transporter substrate-binding protein [Anaerolineae bacterium]|nr:ABC transporter substrate-binding protein [Anaerolineae bacterium]
MRYMKPILLVLLLLTLIVPIAAQDGNLTDSCVMDYDESVNYFSDTVEVEYADGFSVRYTNNYKIVEITPWVGAEETLTYVLVQCGTPPPTETDIEADAIIEVPIDSLVILSTTILPHLDSQGVLDRLAGVDTLQFTSNEAVLERADSIAEVGGEFSGINTELLLDTQPDLIMAQQFSSAGTALDTIQSTGLQVVLNADFADTSPLGQAEWGKFVSLFFNTEAEANAVFENVVAEYDRLAELAEDVEARPTVIAASPFQGSWFMPAGDSYLAQLIEDAGGDFVFSDESGTSIVLDFEVVLEQGNEADYWVNFNQFWATTDDMLADDPRYEEFAAFQNGNLWNNNKRVNGNGGNDYFENGVANPHLLLADLIAIFPS